MNRKRRTRLGDAGTITLEAEAFMPTGPDESDQIDDDVTGDAAVRAAAGVSLTASAPAAALAPVSGSPASSIPKSINTFTPRTLWDQLMAHARALNAKIPPRRAPLWAKAIGAYVAWRIVRKVL